MRWVRLMPQLKSGRLSKLSALRLCDLRRTQRAAVIMVIGSEMIEGFDRLHPTIDGRIATHDRSKTT